jgi:hypothetical protein
MEFEALLVVDLQRGLEFGRDPGRGLCADHDDPELLHDESLTATPGPKRRVEAQRRAHDLDCLPDAFRKAWPSLPALKKSAVTNALVEAAVVRPAVQGRNFFDPERVDVIWKA